MVSSGHLQPTASELAAIYDLLPPLNCNASASDSFSVTNRKHLKCHISEAEPRKSSSNLKTDAKIQ